MKVTFKGGPWNGVVLSFPTLPRWISFGGMLWNPQEPGADIGDTAVLANPADFIYVLRKQDNEVYYELRIVESE
jgi:hypothetical protein